jgi:hypothetical protein
MDAHLAWTAAAEAELLSSWPLHDGRAVPLSILPRRTVQSIAARRAVLIEMQHLRGRLAGMLAGRGETLSHVAPQVGVPLYLLAPWQRGRYVAQPDTVNRSVAVFLAREDDASRTEHSTTRPTNR